jgi:low molecular weight phosphotyrosine protein phosphatase
MAEAVIRQMVYAQTRLFLASIDSAGLHVDPNAPPRNDVLSILEMHSIRSYRHRARRVTKDDLKTYEWVFAMDNTVLAELQTLPDRHREQGAQEARIRWSGLGMRGSATCKTYAHWCVARR